MSEYECMICPTIKVYKPKYGSEICLTVLVWMYCLGSMDVRQVLTVQVYMSEYECT